MADKKDFMYYELDNIPDITELRDASESGEAINFSTREGEMFNGFVNEITSRKRESKEGLVHILEIDEEDTNRTFTIGMNVGNISPYIATEEFRGGKIKGADRGQLAKYGSIHSLIVNGVEFQCKVNNVLWSGPGNGDDPISDLDTGHGAGTFMTRFRVYDNPVQRELQKTTLLFGQLFSDRNTVLEKIVEMRELFLKSV